jgi:NADH-quinone oxidoreductase subunit J
MALAIAFYLLAAVTVGAGFGVVSSRNPVHSVLFLILSFFSAAGLFVTMGAEFLAMLLLDVDFAALRQGFARYMPIGGVVALILAVEMIVVATAVATGGTPKSDTPQVYTDVSNIETIGRVLYTDYVYFFQAAGLVLLVAMIGAIVLTLRHKPGVRRQVISEQVARSPQTGMRVVQVKPGQGIDQ